MQFVMASLAAAVEMRKKMLQEQKAEAAKEKKEMLLIQQFQWIRFAKPLMLS